MGWPVVVTTSGGIPVTQSLNGIGTPVDIAANGTGTPVTLVGHGGIPVLGAAIVPVNLLQHSETFDQWTASSTSVVPNIANDPVRGMATADRIIESAVTAEHSTNPANISFLNATTYTLSVYAKYETKQFLQLIFGAAAFGVNAYANFDIQNGTVQTVGSTATAQIEPAENGWYRLILTATTTAAAAATAAVYGAVDGSSARTPSYPGNISNTWLLADAQVETGAVANIYVPTA